MSPPVLAVESCESFEAEVPLRRFFVPKLSESVNVTRNGNKLHRTARGGRAVLIVLGRLRIEEI